MARKTRPVPNLVTPAPAIGQRLRFVSTLRLAGGGSVTSEVIGQVSKVDGANVEWRLVEVVRSDAPTPPTGGGFSLMFPLPATITWEGV